MIEKFYYEKVIDEIIEIIKTNILLYYGHQDDTFELLKKYCSTKEDDEKYKPVEYFQLVTFTKEAITELMSNKFLYDFRPLE